MHDKGDVDKSLSFTLSPKAPKARYCNLMFCLCTAKKIRSNGTGERLSGKDPELQHFSRSL